MKTTVTTLCIVAFCSLNAGGSTIFYADSEAIDRLAKAEVAVRHTDIPANDLVLMQITWSKDYANEPSSWPPIRIDYTVNGRVETNIIGIEPIEKRLEVRVYMDESGGIPPGYMGVQTTIVSRSAYRPPPENQNVPGTKMLQLNFRNSPLDHVLSLYAELKGLSYVKNDSVHREITAVSSSRLTVDHACSFIESVLKEQGITLIITDDKQLKIRE